MYLSWIPFVIYQPSLAFTQHHNKRKKKNNNKNPPQKTRSIPYRQPSELQSYKKIMQQEFDAMNGALSNIRKWRTPKRASKEPLRGCNSADKCHLIFRLFYEWHWNKGRISTFHISSPSSFLSVLEGAELLNALQFSEKGETKEKQSF